jgi:hypothetical protein
MGEMVRCAGEVNYFRYYKRLGQIAKLATSYYFHAIGAAPGRRYAAFQPVLTRYKLLEIERRLQAQKIYLISL